MSTRDTWTPACLFANLKVSVAVDVSPCADRVLQKDGDPAAASSVAIMVTTEGSFSLHFQWCCQRGRDRRSDRGDHHRIGPAD